MWIKVGQKVRCIGMPPGYNDKLEIGNVYTIASILDLSRSNSRKTIYLYVQENNLKNCYHVECFEPVTADGV